MSSDLLNKAYEPHDVEKRWYAFWEQEKLFAALEKTQKPSYSVVIPPPNVTGVLHMGHALNITMQDILCRYKRLCGDNVLWMPGMDHAGIATQNVVEKKLNAQGLNRENLGREKFVAAVWEWRKESGGAIINQLKRLGASCDWDRERFTMDEGLSCAVRKVFVRLYEEGLIYKDNYIINWCPRCGTALSDLEVEHEELDGFLYHILYPFQKESGGLIVATTRPETMFGDTAVALHPDDERYRNVLAKEVALPLTGRNIPIIRDKYVGLSFGTGALKVTPAHDPNDFEIGIRHKLPALRVIDDQGLMTFEAGRFIGMDRFECREAVVKALSDEGLMKKIEPYRHAVGQCYRCKTVVEPNLSRQWFVRVKPMADQAIAAVRCGDTRIIPAVWEKTYFDWMENIKDWCISRQIWWGHQIPAWTCDACSHLAVATEAPLKCPECGHDSLTQETDVLDTWFSSALWPFSTMGWPDETDLLNRFYPTSVLVTGFDILFFWVARMMMMGLYFRKDVPFKDVYVHALVRDENGKKMSKSKGNVIDPLTVIEQYGTDSFRFTLAAFAAQGRDIKMSEKRVEGYRHFINKIWNVSRFAMMHINDSSFDKIEFNLTKILISLPDKWIISRLKSVTRDVADSLDGYRFNDAAGCLYRFVWHELCDWYLEAVKPALYGDYGEEQRTAAMSVLWRVLHDTLLLLHPFIPFITEEIWHILPGTSGSIMTASFPPCDSGDYGIVNDFDSEAKMNLIIEVITGVRNIRGEMKIPPSLLLSAMLQSDEQHFLDTVDGYRNIIIDLAGLKSLVAADFVERPATSATAVLKGATIFVPLEGVVDFNQEIERLEKELTKLRKELGGVSKKLGNGGFLTKAPPDIVDKVRAKERELLEKQDKLENNLHRIRGIHDSRQ
jgi:valyl-tRNA synthetase